ncbi:MAG: redoxin domain-containing protein [Gemmataceae bacterium]|nr:redoxin domain-containing protein [Gemmataceae bacterium]
MKRSAGWLSLRSGTSLLIVLLAGAALGSQGAAADAKDGELIRTTHFAGLQDAIKQNKGKVVLVDFWADFCIPCKKAFPQLVQMHDKYAKEGLVVISVNLDDPDDNRAQRSAREFLKKQKAPFDCVFFTNAKEQEKAAKHYDIDTIPHLVIYNRQGKLVEDDVDPDKLEGSIKAHLKKK